MKRIYIAGPMTGLPDFNYPAFHAAERQVAAAGNVPLNPARQFGGRTDLPYDVYIKGALQMVLLCDAIYLLPGWQASRGARLEKHVADVLGLEVIYDANA